MISIFELFSIGIGPSSSHTVGPMRAANDFIEHIPNKTTLSKIEIELYGSLALTGKGHGTDRAIIVGLEGHQPNTVEPAYVYQRMNQIIQEKTLTIFNQKISFDYTQHFIFKYEETMPHHTNGICFKAYDKAGSLLHAEIYYSIGGGFIISETELKTPKIIAEKKQLPLSRLPCFPCIR